MLYDFYQAVKTTKESHDENEKFIATIEVEFLLQQISDVNQIDDY
jgi:ribosomal protein L1